MQYAAQMRENRYTVLNELEVTEDKLCCLYKNLVEELI